MQLFRKGVWLQVPTVTGISTNWFENFQRFELWRVILWEFFPREATTGSSYREGARVREIGILLYTTTGFVVNTEHVASLLHGL